MRLKISARKSDLARLQAYMVGEALKEKNPQIEIIYKFRESLGDINLTDPLWKIPEKGVFTEDFYGELLREETDMVVHSWKDLPTEGKPDTHIAATMPRADQRDLLIIKKAHFARIKESGQLNIFSSSPRREYNLTQFFKDHLPFNLQNVKFESVRGNILTRVKKLLDSNETDGLIVAKAALDRLLTASQSEFLENQITLKSYMQELEFTVLPLSVNPNAAAQGALAIEILNTRTDLKEILKSIHDESTFVCAQKERDILASFGGGCHQKIGIAVLDRPYGAVTFLRGLTDGGSVLNTNSITRSQSVKFSPDKMWASEASSVRTPLSADIPKNANGLFIAKSEAWNSDIQPLKVIWTAGLKTWKSLAQKGIWVHGSSESLGESESARIDILAGEKIQWAKLSHQEGYVSGQDNMQLVPTYELKTELDIQDLENKDAFFWNSGSQYLAAVALKPEIRKAYHSSGPGNTYEIVKKDLIANSTYSAEKLTIYLDQENWRQECTL